MTLSHVVAILLALLVALPGDSDALVSGAAPTPVSIALRQGEPPLLVFAKASERAKVVSLHEVRSEFDEGGDLMIERGNVALPAFMGFMVWPSPVAIQCPSEPLPIAFRPIPSWRLLGRYRC